MLRKSHIWVPIVNSAAPQSNDATHIQTRAYPFLLTPLSREREATLFTALLTYLTTPTRFSKEHDRNTRLGLSEDEFKKYIGMAMAWQSFCVRYTYLMISSFLAYPFVALVLMLSDVPCCWWSCFVYPKVQSCSLL